MPITNREEKLIEVGNALARAMEPAVGAACPGCSCDVPCTRNAYAEQWAALVYWQHLVDEIEES